MFTAISLTAITTHLNNSGISYRKAITGDPFSEVRVEAEAFTKPLSLALLD
jgi:hypothetical protein